MLKFTFNRPVEESRPYPQFNELCFDVDKKQGTFVPQRPVDYPPVEMFDLDVLDANGVSPELITQTLISPTLEETDNDLDYVSQILQENELV